jgi:2-hydroxy-6-oxonona-2,4-dienedioate hydrolase
MSQSKLYLFAILVGILAIGSATIFTRYQREIIAEREQIKNLGSQVIHTDCGSIEYAVKGDGSPILVVHGAMGGFDQGLLTANHLIEAGYQVIAVSRFGYLLSPIPENATLDMQVDLFACLLDELGIQQTALLGVSAGATSAIRYAARYPERVSVLILQVPAAPGEDLGSPPPKAAFTMMRSDFVYWGMVTYLRPVTQRMAGVPGGFKLTPESEAVVRDVLATTLPSSERINGFSNDFQFQTSEFYEEVSENSPYSVYHIEIPVLVIQALDDPIALPENVRSLEEKFPNARLFVVPDGGHLLLGHSEEVNGEIQRFLQDELVFQKNSQ